MNDLELFFSKVSSKERDDEKFFEDLIFLAAHEWHFTPDELLEIEIPMTYLLLRKQLEFNKQQEKNIKRR